MIRDEFKAEVDYLFQLCEELGERQPALAPVLGRSADPAVTRLVEGLAFSFARLRQRLDDDLPEIIHPVVDTLCPDVLRPVPSSAILELRPSKKSMSLLRVKAKSAFASRPVDGVPCIFRSTEDCEVAPWELTRVDVGSERRSIRLVLELFDGAELTTAMPSALRLFLALPIGAALDLRALLLRKTSRVIVRALGGADGIELPLPAAPPVYGRVNDGALAPLASAFLDLRDYFVSPQTSAFVELSLSAAREHLDASARRIEIELTLGEALPRGITLEPSNLLLHAVPVINVFAAPTVNAPLAGDDRRAHVRLDDDLADGEIFAVERVSLVSRALQSMPVERWTAFSPPSLGRTDAPRAFYEIHRTPSVVGASLDVSLSFTTASGDRLDATDFLAAEIDVLATNGTRAGRVGLGEVCVPTATSPSLVSFRNVTPVTRGIAPMLDGDRAWSFFRLLKASLATLTEPSSLSGLLALANLPAAAGWPEAKPDRERFSPLLSVQRKHDCTAVRDDLHLGAAVRVAVDATRFSGPGDVHLFAERLVPLFAAPLRAHEWVDVAIADRTGKVLFAFPRTYGARHGV